MGLLDVEPNEVRWTAKAPALIAGLIALALALVATGRRAYLAAGVLLVLAVAFIGYSLTVKDWCEMRGGASGFSSAFAPTFSQCVKQKGWLAF